MATLIPRPVISVSTFSPANFTISSMAICELTPNLLVLLNVQTRRSASLQKAF